MPRLIEAESEYTGRLEFITTIADSPSLKSRYTSADAPEPFATSITKVNDGSRASSLCIPAILPGEPAFCGGEAIGRVGEDDYGLKNGYADALRISLSRNLTYERALWSALR